MKAVSTELKPLDIIKNEIKSSINKQIIIQEINKLGRVVKEYHCEVISAYENVFLVNVIINSNKIKRSFSYVDFLTSEFKYDIV